MSTKYPEIFDALAAEFDRKDVKSLSRGGREFWFSTARVYMNRLDSVLGPENWWDEYVPSENSVLCRLTIRLPDGSTLTKSDAGGYAGMADSGDDSKSGVSDAFKRACVKFGVGRYLYNDGTPRYDRREGTEGHFGPRGGDEHESKAQKLVDWCTRKGLIGQAQSLARRNFDQTLAQLSDQDATSIYELLRQMGAKPEAEVERRHPPGTREASQAPGNNPNGTARDFRWPHSGAALFAWTKSLEDAFRPSNPRVDLVRGVVDAQFVSGKGWDRSWKTWERPQVEEAALAVAAAVSLLEGYDGQFADRLPDLKKLRDRVWTAAAGVIDGLGGQPTTETIEAQVHLASTHICSKFGGEVVNDLAECDNLELLKALATELETDLADTKAAF